MHPLRLRSLVPALAIAGSLIGAGSQAGADLVRSVRDGYWDADSTWNVNRAPTQYDTVFVEDNVTIRTSGTTEVTNLYVQPSGALLSEAPYDIDILAYFVLQVHGWVQGASGINGCPPRGPGTGRKQRHP